MLYISILHSTVFLANSLDLSWLVSPWECVVLVISVEIMCLGEILRTGGQEIDDDEKMYLLYVT